MKGGSMQIITSTTPIFISVPREPDRCPKCNEIENKKVVCRHCGYEYKDDDDFSFWDWVGIIAIVSIGLYTLVTILCWFMSGDTLLKLLKSQWEWLSSLKIF
jgi:hypothetical protein